MNVIEELRAAVRDVRYAISEHLAHERMLRRNGEDDKADIRAARADELRQWDARMTRWLAEALKEKTWKN